MYAFITGQFARVLCRCLSQMRVAHRRNLIALATAAAALHAAPTITTQPINTTATAGQPAAFTVTATGTGTLSYQWRRAGYAIAGAAASSYQITTSSRTDADYYDVVVTDSTGSVTSQPAQLSVSPTTTPGNLVVSTQLLAEKSGATIHKIWPLGDGRYYASGDFSSVNGLPRSTIVRLNQDGSVDTTFSPPTISNRDLTVGHFEDSNTQVATVAVQSDGKVVIGGYFSSVDGQSRQNLARLNSNGSLDTSFRNRGIDADLIGALAIQPDGKILAGGQVVSFFIKDDGTYAATPALIRLNSDGTVDSTFNAPSTQYCYALAIQSDGKVLAGGWIAQSATQSAAGLMRLNLDGTFDTTFNVTGFVPVHGYINTVRVLTTGRILIGGDIDSYNGTSIGHFACANSSGALDTTFNTGTGFDATVYDVAIDANSNVIVAGFFGQYNGTSCRMVARLTPNGNFDSTFSAPSPNAIVYAIAVDPNGACLVGGTFDRIGTTTRTAIARLSTTGSLDGGFSPVVRARGNVTCSLALPGGKILVGGDFQFLGGIALTSWNLARIQSDGTVDTTFKPTLTITAPIESLARQGDGEILVSGYSGLNAANSSLIRITSDGVADTSFQPNTSGVIFQVAATRTGQIMTSGTFQIRRLNADGTTDGTFNSIAVTNGYVSAILPLADGRCYAGGTFDHFAGLARGGLVRLGSDGTVDTGFANTGPGSQVVTLAAQGDGKLVIGTSGSPANPMRYNADGTVDLTFSSGLSGAATGLTQQPDGRLLAVGYFFAINNSINACVARFNADGSRDATLNVAGTTGPANTMLLLDNGQIFIGGPSSVGAAITSTGYAATITTAPTSQNSTLGGTTTFSAAATGTGPLTYQWYHNGAAIAGATNSSLTLTNIQATDRGNYSLTVSNPFGSISSSNAVLEIPQFFAIGDSGTLLCSADGSTWIARTSGTTKRLRAMAVSGATLVTVGETGTVLRSLDGVTWTSQTSGTTASLRGIAASSTRFIAVGGRNSGAIITSTDGQTWNPVSALTGPLRAITYGNNLFVAVGNMGAIFTSPDGLTWSPRGSNTTARLDGVVWTGTRFEAMSATGMLFASSDGITWDNGYQAYPPTWLEGVAWNSAKYVAVGGQGQIKTSNDGRAWSTSTSNTAATLHGVLWTGAAQSASGDPAALLGNIDFRIVNNPIAQSVSAGLSAVFNVIASAPTATIQWLKNSVPIAGATSPTLTVSNAQSASTGAYSVTISNGVASVTSPVATLSLLGQGSLAQQFVAVGQNGTILTSPDGQQWTARASGTSRRLRAATANASLLVAVGEAGTILTSSDGVTWSPAVSGTTTSLRGVAFGGGAFVTVGGTGSPTILYSTDGSTWSASAPLGGSGLRSIAWGNGVFVAVGQAGTAFKSSDGLNWTAVGIVTTERLDAVAWTGTQFDVITQSGNLLTSTDAAIWTSSSVIAPAWIEGFAWNGSRYLAVGAGGQIETTANGVAWTGALSGTTATLHGVTWTGAATTASVNLSTALASLVQLPLLTAPLPALVGINGTATFVAQIGSAAYQWLFNGTPISNSSKYTGATTRTLTVANVGTSDVGTYSIVATSANGTTTAGAGLVLRGQGSMGQQFVAVGDGGTLLTSTDATSWTQQNSGTTRRLRSVTAGPSLFVAAGEAGTIVTSTDGMTWTARTSATTQTLRGVTASPLRYIAVGGDAGAVVVTSTDGTTWTPVAVSSPGTLRSVTYGPSGFIAVGRNGAVLRSADGLSWTSINVGTTDRLEGVLWTGSQYAAITQFGTILTSTDGITWGSAAVNLASWIEGLAWNTAKYVVVGASGQIATSADASTWTSMVSPTFATLHGVVWSGGAPIPSGDPATLLGTLGQTPVITANPASAIVTAGSPATLSVTATGTGLTYQWYKNGVAITGATNTTLSIATAQGRDSGQYRVVVRGPNGTATSATAYLTIPPVYTFSTLAGSTGTPGNADGPGTAARFNAPEGIVSDGNGSFYVADSANNTIRKVTATGDVTTVAGSAGVTGTADGTGTAAFFSSPRGIACDPSGVLYVSDAQNSTIRKVTFSGVVTTFAGQAGVAGSNDGSGTSARFTTPSGVALDTQKNLYVADLNHTIRKITPSAIVSTVAGQAGSPGFSNGSGSSARFYYPLDVATDPNGNLFVADSLNGYIRQISPDGTIRIVAQVPEPSCVARDASGNLFVTG